LSSTILDVKDLKKRFRQAGGMLSGLLEAERYVAAVDGVSFYIKENETVGLVGESGCGKTTVGKSILGLTGIDSGSIVFEGAEISRLRGREFAPYRKRMQMIFQDLDAALNPNMQVGAALREAVNVHQKLTDAEADRKVSELLDQVSIKKSKLARYPHELSGGEKRRIGIARTLAVGARFIVADEPTSALDVSIQAQIVNLLLDLQKAHGLSYLFISHDLPIVELVSHKVAVMYLGKIVEMGLSSSIARSPRHPYTRVLWSSLVNKGEGRHGAVNGGPNGHGPRGAGCRFAPRCPAYVSMGRPGECESEPHLKAVSEGHSVACHFPY
jgi:oligopeptide/dipeptide ABC transporter ATP-binding protein